MRSGRIAFSTRIRADLEEEIDQLVFDLAAARRVRVTKTDVVNEALELGLAALRESLKQ